MRIVTAAQAGSDAWVLGLVGLQTERFRSVTLTVADLAGLQLLDSGPTYDGDGRLLRLGLQAYALGIAWEFDPYDTEVEVSVVSDTPTELS